MTSHEFEDWLKTMGFSGLEAARQLGLSPDAVVRYRKNGTGSKLHIDLACTALAQRLDPWPIGESTSVNQIMLDLKQKMAVLEKAVQKLALPPDQPPAKPTEILGGRRRQRKLKI